MFDYFQHDLAKGLERQDFIRFASEFSKVIFENIPTIEDLEFFDPPKLQPAVVLSETKKEEKIRQDIERAVELGKPVLNEEVLILPFDVGDSTVVAKINGLDEYLIRKIGNDWLSGLSARIVREFLLVKRACVDPLTGLLSSVFLEQYFNSVNREPEGVLVLLTIYPRCSSSFQAKKIQFHNVSLLKSFVDDRFPIYYLGQSCFAVVCEKKDSYFAAEFAPLLVNYFKREGCYRVHVSSTIYNNCIGEKDSLCTLSDTVMKKAWTALHVATKRGRFAFCNYSSIEDSDSHPLVPPALPLVKWLKKCTRNLQKFSLIQFDISNILFEQSVQQLTGVDNNIFVDENVSYLLLPGHGGKGSLEISQKIIQHYNKKDTSGAPFNCGISTFPLGNFYKIDTLMNCRKALCHADFLKPGASVVCDAVSCNIAGDMYYGDGDLVLAIKEYKRGLLLDPTDGNLLNSLGVCYAQMDNHKVAVECFRKACDSRNDRFMALYNLGLEYQICDDKFPAIDSFSEALVVPEQGGEESSRKDIRFQLAVLNIDVCEYRRGYEFMVSWYEAEKPEGKQGKALRFLGKACFGLGRFREAMKYLQQAMQHDEYDADVLGLLGELYLIENEGDDIALRFCEKAVELDPYSLELKLQLAKAQIQGGDFLKGVQSLRPCLRNKKTRQDALLQRGLLEFEKGQVGSAKKWFLKVKSSPASVKNKEFNKIASLYLEKMG